MSLRPVAVLAVLLAALGTSVLLTAPTAGAATAPTVTGVSPAFGRTGGGAEVTVAGANLTGVTKVLFGTTSSTRITHVSSSLLRVTSPKHGTGRVDLRVSSSAGTSRTSASDYFYYVSGAPKLSWTAAHTVSGTGTSGGNDLTDVSCAAVDHCVAIDENADVYTWNGHVMSRRPGKTPGHVTWYQLSCPSTTFCAATGRGNSNGAIYGMTWNGTSWTAGTLVVANGDSVYGMSCSSPALCVAVTYGGSAATYRNGHWSAVDISLPDINGSKDNPTDVSCPSDTGCMAVYALGRFRTYNGTTWSAAGTIYGPSVGAGSVTCTLTTYCTVVGSDNNSVGDAVYVRRGTTWGNEGPLPFDPGETFNSSQSSCPATDFCVAVTHSYGDGEGGSGIDEAATLTGQASGTTDIPLYDGDQQISCPTSTLCMAIDDTEISLGRPA